MTEKKNNEIDLLMQEHTNSLCSKREYIPCRVPDLLSLILFVILVNQYAHSDNSRSNLAELLGLH